MSQSVRRQVVSQMVRLTGHAALERIRPSRPTAMGQMPRSTGFLTSQWLTAALCNPHPEARVVDFSLGGGSDGSTSRRAVHVTYNEAGRKAGLPTQLFSKSTPNLASRLLTLPTGALEVECLFYNTIRPTLDIETPVGYYADFDSFSGRSMILLEDVGETKAATFGDPTKVHIDWAKAEHIVRLLGTVHGTFWDSPRFNRDLRRIKDAECYQLDINKLIRFRSRSMVGIERAEQIVPKEFLRRRDELWPALLRSLALHHEEPMTLLHSDVHSRNWYVTGDGRMGLYDWQCITKGSWGLDVAYAISSALTVENRRSWEQELLDIYLEQLAESGGDKLSFDDAWLTYRQQIFHGLFFWLFTLGEGFLEPAMQPRAVSMANIERMAHMVIDLGCLDTL
jgi:Phosphotransferase enzyme family